MRHLRYGMFISSEVIQIWELLSGENGKARSHSTKNGSWPVPPAGIHFTGPAFVCSIRDRQIAAAMVISADNDEAASSTNGGAECTVS